MLRSCTLRKHDNQRFHALYTQHDLKKIIILRFIKIYKHRPRVHIKTIILLNYTQFTKKICDHFC